MNRKGAFELGIAGLVLLIVVAILGIFLLGGGLSGFALSTIPAWVWVLLGIFILFKIAGGKKK